MSIQYFRDELIDILKKRDFSKLAFRKFDNGVPYAYCILFTTGTSADEDEAFANGTPDSVEVSVNTPDNKISDETADRMIDVLEHLDECIQRAYDWMSKHDLPYAWLLKKEYPMCELDFGVASIEPRSKKRPAAVFHLSSICRDLKIIPGIVMFGSITMICSRTRAKKISGKCNRLRCINSLITEPDNRPANGYPVLTYLVDF